MRIYNQKGSSISLADLEDFPWEEILEGVDHFHFSSITPVLDRKLPEIVTERL